MPIFSCSKRYTQVIRKSNVDQQQGKRGFLLLKHRLRCLACFGSKRIGGCSLTFLAAVGSVQAENELSILPFFSPPIFPVLLLPYHAKRYHHSAEWKILFFTSLRVSCTNSHVVSEHLAFSETGHHIAVCPNSVWMC